MLCTFLPSSIPINIRHSLHTHTSVIPPIFSSGISRKPAVVCRIFHPYVVVDYNRHSCKFSSMFTAESSPGVGLAIVSCNFQSPGVSNCSTGMQDMTRGGSFNKNLCFPRSYLVPGCAHTTSPGVKTRSTERLSGESLSCFLKTAAFQVQKVT